jgi:hypothetical protein
MSHQDLDFVTHSTWHVRPEQQVDADPSFPVEPPDERTFDSYHGFPVESPHEQQIDAHQFLPVKSPDERAFDSHHGFPVEPAHAQPVDLRHGHLDLDPTHHVGSADEGNSAVAAAWDPSGDAGTDPFPAEPDDAANLNSVAITANYGDDPWHLQDNATSCAIAAQRGILESQLGYEIPEEELRDLAIREHWYEPGSGTNGADVGRLLEHFGIPVERGYGCHLTTLYSALQEGRSVLVGVNAEGLQPADGSDGADALDIRPHVVQVIGMSFDDAGQMSLHLNDSAKPTGHDTTIDAQSFLHAWTDCGNFAAIAGE